MITSSDTRALCEISALRVCHRCKPCAVSQQYPSGPEHFDDVKAYVENHQLYETALEIFAETDELQVRVACSSPIALIHGALQEILNLYGEWLFERREFDQSALGMLAIVPPLPSAF